MLFRSAEPVVNLRERSAKAEWKGILITSIVGTCAAMGFLGWMAPRYWVGTFGKEIELHSMPFLVSALCLGLVWVIRSTRNFLRCSAESPMAWADYILLRDIVDDSSFPRDRLTRWTVAVLLATGASAFQPAPDSGDSMRISIITF